jgi:hypothetical protein
MVSKTSAVPWRAVPLLLLTSLSIAFISYGYYGQKLLDQKNSCEMTYSSPKFKRMEMPASAASTSASASFALYAHGSLDSLNPIPVLFVPGNLGSYVPSPFPPSPSFPRPSSDLLPLDRSKSVPLPLQCTTMDPSNTLLLTLATQRQRSTAAISWLKQSS